MDAAAKKWIQQYKKLFDQVAARNAGMNVVEDVTTVERKEQVKKIGKLVDELGGTATQVPKKVIKKIGKLVPEDKKTASGTKVQDSGERFAVESTEDAVIDLSENNQLSAIVEGVYGSQKYKKIAEYIKNVLGNEELRLSDGKMPAFLQVLWQWSTSVSVRRISFYRLH